MTPARAAAEVKRARQADDDDDGGGRRPAHPWRVADDVEEKGFVWDSVARRLRTIVAQCAEGAGNPQHAAALRRIAQALEDGTYCLEPVDASDGGPDWTQLVNDHVAARNTNKAFLVDWFFLETFMYRVMLHELDYFRTHLDPFLGQKKQAFAASAQAFLHSAANGKCTFEQLALNALWGNRSDLSVSSGSVDVDAARALEGHLLVNDLALAHEHLLHASKSKPVLLVLDNCGAELANDLRMANFLVHALQRTVELHVKASPTFVSDATAVDVDWHVEEIGKLHAPLGSELTRARKSHALKVLAHDFYNGPLSYAHAPAELKQKYRDAALVILKGDANYRRLVADVPRAYTTPLGQVAEIAGPVLALRTMKSPICVGLDAATVAVASARNPKFTLDGSHGVAQFYHAA
jgi:uncharacterized protein with ATP-grasp and redox domains